MPPNPPDIQWILLDLGGVVVQEPTPRVRAAVGRCLGLSPQRVEELLRPYADDATCGRATLGEIYADLLPRIGCEATPQEALAAHLAAYREVALRPAPAILRLIERLRRHVGVACLSNTEVEIGRLSRDMGLLDVFDGVYLSPELGAGKPHPDAYTKVLADLGCRPGQAVFVDDRPENVAAAEALGMHAIHFTSADALAAALADRLPWLAGER